MEKYNHQAGLRMVGELLPYGHNRVTLADDEDQYGLKIPRITYTYSDNDKKLIQHGMAWTRWSSTCGPRERRRSSATRTTPTT